MAESWAKPAALLRLEGLAHNALPKKKRRRILTTISQSGRAAVHLVHRNLRTAVYSRS